MENPGISGFSGCHLENIVRFYFKFTVVLLNCRSRESSHQCVGVLQERTSFDFQSGLPGGIFIYHLSTKLSRTQMILEPCTLPICLGTANGYEATGSNIV